MKNADLLFRSLAVASLVSLSLCTPAAGQQPTPYLRITADNDTIDVPLSTEGKMTTFDSLFETAGYQIQISGAMNSDPSIAYGIAVADFGAPSVFGFAFFTPIVPTGPATTVTGSIVGGLTDFTGDGVSITPTGPTVQSSDVNFPATSMGVSVGPGAAFGAGPAGSFYAYGPYAAGPIPGPAGIWTGLGVTTGFSLSGGGDIAALTGFASVETASVPDGGAGVVGLVVLLGVALVNKGTSAIGV
jgi:hypothetical protein